MRAPILAIAVHRPVTMSMVFVALAILGTFSWFRIPVELVPAFNGEQLYVQYYRASSEPGVVEREILIPLESRVKQLPGVLRTSGEIAGNIGNLNIEFEPGTNYRIRELELRRIVADLLRNQPEGTVIKVSTQDTSLVSRYVMSLQVVGGDDPNILRDIVEERIQPKLESLSGVGQVFVYGGANREVSVFINPQRCAELGVTVPQVNLAIKRAVGELRYLGSTEENRQRISILVDDRPDDVSGLGEIRILPNLPVLLRHIAKIEMSTSPQESVSRINGQASISLIIFQEQGANLIKLGNDLRVRLGNINKQINPVGLNLLVGFDASDKVSEQLEHLKRLASSGFIIALLVLFLFLRKIKAVAVVAIAVPMSLLTAGALLYLAGYSLNLFTLFGLVIGVGMLVDNSIVVYEAVQRNLDKGQDSESASIGGISRTARAIITASATNVVVFLPLVYLNEIPLTVRLILENIVPAILFPLAASLFVAVGLVPMLAQRLVTTPSLDSSEIKSSVQPIRRNNQPEFKAAREIFSGLLKVVLRQPSNWLIGTSVVIFLTLFFALPWVLVQSINQPSADTDLIRIEVEFEGGGSLESAGLVFDRLEHAVLSVKGVERVESNYQEEKGTITVYLNSTSGQTKGASATRVRHKIYSAVEGMANIQLRPINSRVAIANNSGDSVDEASKISVSGPDMAQLSRLAEQIKIRLKTIPQISGVSDSTRKSADEIYVETYHSALDAHQLYVEDALSTLVSVGREGLRLPVGFNLNNKKEIPIVIRSNPFEALNPKSLIEQLPVVGNNSVLPLTELVAINRIDAPISIAHQNGRREVNVFYYLNEKAPQNGPKRLELENSIHKVVNGIYVPKDYSITVASNTQSTDWFKLIFIPIVFFLYALLAISFESLTLPLLILVTVPFTIFGSVWALFISGLGADMMAAVGVVVLLGLTVNPAILLVDRMQQKLRTAGGSSGKSAMIAVRERVRPVMMTSCTTIAGLWPLAIAKGQELELWPPFATVVMGGLVASTLLTLIAIPIGFVMLSKLDKTISFIGPWKMMLWGAATVSTLAVFILSGLLESLLWQFSIACLIGAFYFWILVKIFCKQSQMVIENSEMSLETRFLSKTYSKLGPIASAWQRCNKKELGNSIESIFELKNKLLSRFIFSIASIYLAANLSTIFWRVVFSYLAGAIICSFLINVYRLVELRTNKTKSKYPTEILRNEKKLFYAFPWIVLIVLFCVYSLFPLLNGDSFVISPIITILLGLLTLMLQLGRTTANNVLNENNHSKLLTGRFSRIRSNWRDFCIKYLSFNLPSREHRALCSINFKAKSGLIGILGPNGAGKTTLFRVLANILDSTSGTIYYADVEKREIINSLSGLIGYLPQEFGLPGHLSAKEYLNYYALMYKVGNSNERQSRVEKLLNDVGLSDKKNHKISSFSGGMRQRVAVARTLLNEPPIILVDEPTAGLDPRERIRFRNLLSRLAKQRIILFSTHVIEDVAAACDRVIVVKKGSIVFDGKPLRLAALAKNKIWQVILPTLKAKHLEIQHKVISQIPAELDNVCLRVLSESKPHQSAEVLEPNLEDGYFQLFSEPVLEKG